MNPVRSIFLVMGQQPQKRRRNKSSLNCIFSSSTEDLSSTAKPIPKGTVNRIYFDQNLTINDIERKKKKHTLYYFLLLSQEIFNDRINIDISHLVIFTKIS